MTAAHVPLRVKTDLRYELKYLIDERQEIAIRAALAQRMTPDAHGDASGRYTITSLYYDTSDYRAFWEKLEGLKVRRKVRVRVYGDEPVTPETSVYLEIKQRVNRLMGKRRAYLPYAGAIDFDNFDRRTDEISDTDREVLKEVYYLYTSLQLQPTCVVRYRRVAYNGDEEYPDLRVTFDTQVQGRISDLSLLSNGSEENQLLMPPGWTILEVKVNRSVPYWLTQILSQERCTFRRISKYCAALEKSSVIRSRQRILTA